jgi:ankyrin repeat protein
MRLLRLFGFLAAFGMMVGGVEAMKVELPMAKFLRAAANGDLETVKQLVDDKFYPPSFDKSYVPVNGYGRNPDFSDFKMWRDEIVIRRVTALYEAALNGHLDVVKFLLQKGADVSAVIKDPFGSDFPLMAAVRGGHVDVVACLVGVPGINIDQKSGPGPGAYTALTLAQHLIQHPHRGQTRKKTENYGEIVKLLKDAKGQKAEVPSAFTGKWACVDCGFLNAFDKSWCEAKRCRQMRRHRIEIPSFELPQAAPSAPASAGVFVQPEMKVPKQGVSPEDESVRSKLRDVARSGTAQGLEALLPPELGRDEILRRLHLADKMKNTALMSAGANVNLEFIKYVWRFVDQEDKEGFLYNAVIKDFPQDSQEENRQQQMIDYLVKEQKLSLDKTIGMYKEDNPEKFNAIARLEAAKKRLHPPAPIRKAPKREKPEVKAPEPVVPQGAWACPACAFKNVADDSVCVMCGWEKA